MAKTHHRKVLGVATAFVLFTSVLMLLRAEPAESPSGFPGDPEGRARVNRGVLHEPPANLEASPGEIDRGSAGRTPAEPESPRRREEIRVAVVERSGSAVPGVHVEARGPAGHRWVSEDDDGDGVHTFPARAGETSFRVVPDTVPAGLLPPTDPDRFEPYLPAYVKGQRVTVERGRTPPHVTITLSREGRIRGVVRDGEGRPVEGVWVRFTCALVGVPMLWEEALTDPSGRYEITLPGSSYRSTVVPPEAMRARGVSHAEAVDIELTGGDEQVHDFTVGRRDCAVHGRVVDQDGAPVEGIKVLAYQYIPFEELAEGLTPYTMANDLGRALTDAGGNYSLELPATSLRLHFGYGQYDPRAAQGENLLGLHSDPTWLDLRGASGAIDAGLGVVHLSRPYEARLVPSDALVEYIDAVGRAEIVVTAERLEDHPKRGLIRKPVWSHDGSLRWWCETPEAPVKVSFRSLAAADGLVGEVVLVPRFEVSEQFEVVLLRD